MGVRIRPKRRRANAGAGTRVNRTVPLASAIPAAVLPDRSVTVSVRLGIDPYMSSIADEAFRDGARREIVQIPYA